jgi:hypothetical protein
MKRSSSDAQIKNSGEVIAISAKRNTKQHKTIESMGNRSNSMAALSKA